MFSKNFQDWWIQFWPKNWKIQISRNNRSVLEDSWYLILGTEFEYSLKNVNFKTTVINEGRFNVTGLIIRLISLEISTNCLCSNNELQIKQNLKLDTTLQLKNSLKLSFMTTRFFWDFIRHNESNIFISDFGIKYYQVTLWAFHKKSFIKIERAMYKIKECVQTDTPVHKGLISILPRQSAECLFYNC